MASASRSEFKCPSYQCHAGGAGGPAPPPRRAPGPLPCGGPGGPAAAPPGGPAWSASLSRVKVTVTMHWQAIVTVTGPPVRRSQPVRGTVWVTGGRRSGLRVSPSRSA